MSEKEGCGGLLVGAAGFALVWAGFLVPTWTPVETVTCTVTEKDRGGRPSDMRVYTADCGTLTVADSLPDGRWDSADLFGRIEPGRYQFITRGMRVPLLSIFPNIITAERTGR